MVIIKHLRSIALYAAITAGGVTAIASPLWRTNEAMSPEYDETELSLVWSSQIASYQREGENRISDLKRLEDGTFLGIYNSGAEALVQEGRMVHLSKDGKSLWEVSIQPGFNSSAERMAVKTDGAAFVTGTTMVDGLTLPYLVSVDEDGNIEFSNIIETPLQNISPVSIDVAGNDVVVTYCGTEVEGGNRQLVLEKYDASGKKIETLTRDTDQIFAPLRTYSLDGFLMVPFFGSEAIAFDLSSMEEALCEKLDGGKFHNGCVSGNALYNLYQNTDEMAEVIQYKVVDGKLTKSWTQKTEQSWESYNMSLFPVNDGNIALYVNRLNTTSGMTVIGADGKIVKENKSISYNSWQTGFVHCVGQSSSGDYYLLTQLSSTFKIQMVQIDEDLEETKSFALKDFNEDYIYYYLNSRQAYFDDDRFMIGGSMRPLDYQASGYTTFFAEINVEKDNDPQWYYACSPGKISDVSPFYPIADATGNCYLYYRSYYDTFFTKFDSTGKSSWDIKLPESIAYLFTPILMENGNILFGGAGYDNQMTLICVNSDGETVFTKPGETGGLSEILTITAALDGEGNIMTCFAGRDATYACKLYVAKYNQEGECIDKRMLDTSTQGITLSGMLLTSDNGIIVYGKGYDNNWIAFPCVAGIDGNLNLDFLNLSDSSALQGIQYTDGVIQDGKIYLIGKTYSTGFVDIYTAQGALEKNIVYEGSTQYSLIEGIVRNPEGGVILVGERLGKGETFEGMILSMDSDGSISEEKTVTQEDCGIYLFRIFKAEDGFVIAGTRSLQNNGFQTMTFFMDNQLQIIAECADPMDGSYLNYVIRGASFANGRLFVANVENIGTANNGFVTCFGINLPASIKDMMYSDRSWESGSEEVYYTLQGIKVSNPTPGLYLRITNGKCEKVIIK